MKAVVLVGSVLCALPGSLLAQPMTPARIAAAAVHNPLPAPGSAPRDQPPHTASPGDGEPCYPNCDNSTAVPILNAADFTCFANRYANGHAYADCNGAGGLTIVDFGCFLNAFVAGCP